MNKKLCITVAALLVGNPGIAQEDDSNWKASVVVPGIHMLESDRGFAGGNLGLLVGDDGVVLIDDGMPTIPATTVAQVEEITGNPVNFVINTHAHGDHTGANAAFMERGATVVSHDNLREALTRDEQYDQSALPELTFNDSVTFHLNGHTAYVFHIPSAHTSGDAGIHFTDVNVIHTGDVMFNGMFPFIDIDGGGSVDGLTDRGRHADRLAVTGESTCGPGDVAGTGSGSQSAVGLPGLELGLHHDGALYGDDLPVTDRVKLAVLVDSSAK